MISENKKKQTCIFKQDCTEKPIDLAKSIPVSQIKEINMQQTFHALQYCRLKN